MLKTSCYVLVALFVGATFVNAQEISDPEDIIQNTGTINGMVIGPAAILNNYGEIKNDHGIGVTMTGRGTINNSDIISGTTFGVKSDNQDDGDVYINNRSGALITSTEICPGCSQANAAIYIERRSNNAWITNMGTITSADNLAIQSLQALSVVAILNRPGGVINGNIVIRKTLAYLVLEQGSAFNGDADLRENFIGQVILRGTQDEILDSKIVGAHILYKEGTGSWTIESDMSFSEFVTVRSGTLIVNGSLSAPTIYVHDGAHLLGNGKISGNIIAVDD